jgi:hypothetical protein
LLACGNARCYFEARGTVCASGNAELLPRKEDAVLLGVYFRALLAVPLPPSERDQGLRAVPRAIVFGGVGVMKQVAAAQVC